MTITTKITKPRQIPSSKKYCANKSYTDELYAYFQHLSQRDENGMRFFYKKDVNFTQIGEAFEISRQTVSSKFKNLEKLNLIVLSEDKTKYYLTILDKTDATLLPYSLLEYMLDALSERGYSTYCYLFNRFWANNQQPFEFTYEQLKIHLGLCTTTRSNDHIITNNLISLAKNDLISYELIAKTGNDNGSVKTVYRLIAISNEKPSHPAVKTRKSK